LWTYIAHQGNLYLRSCSMFRSSELNNCKSFWNMTFSYSYLYSIDTSFIGRCKNLFASDTLTEEGNPYNWIVLPLTILDRNSLVFSAIQLHQVKVFKHVWKQTIQIITLDTFTNFHISIVYHSCIYKKGRY
jgi:hypothetical protein